MKNDGLIQFLGDCVIAAAIIFAGCIIAFNLPETTQVPSIPSSLSVDTHTHSEQVQYGDYLSRYEVAGYLKISSDEVDRLQLYKNGLNLDCLTDKFKFMKEEIYAG